MANPPFRNPLQHGTYSDAPCCAIGWSCIAPDHPALPGHFPGEPLVPGVLLLAHVQALLDEALPSYQLASLPNVKFLQPVKPAMSLMLGIELQAQDTQHVRGRFLVRHQNTLMAQGQFVSSSSAVSGLPVSEPHS